MKWTLLALMMLASTPSSAQIDPRCALHPDDSSCVPIRPHQQLIPGPNQQLIPVQPPYQPPQPAGYMFCYSNEPAPGTKNVYVSDVFSSSQSESAEANGFASYAASQRYHVTFTCRAGSFTSLQQESGQVTVNFANRGYKINQIRHR